MQALIFDIIKSKEKESKNKARQGDQKHQKNIGAPQF
jgi:hypothetical protein